jgi:hypothetical protein
MRVYFTHRCNSTVPWETPEILFEPADASWHSMLDFGRPHLVLNRGDAVVHVVFHEQNYDGPVLDLLRDGNVWWARRPFPTCP